MYFNDPTLYGATLPQREFNLHTPYFSGMYGPWQELPGMTGHNLPMQGLPWQQIPLQGMPWQQIPYQAMPWQQLPIQGLPWQQFPVQAMPWRQYVPQSFPHTAAPFQAGVAPYYKSSPSYPTPFMTTPYTPSGLGSYVQGNYCNVPYYGWQRPW